MSNVLIDLTKEDDEALLANDEALLSLDKSVSNGTSSPWASSGSTLPKITIIRGNCSKPEMKSSNGWKILGQTDEPIIIQDEKLIPQCDGRPPKRARLDVNATPENSVEDQHLRNYTLFKKLVTDCVAFETNDFDKKRVEEKLQVHYDKANPAYLKSIQFENLLTKQQHLLSANTLYNCVKEVLDELKYQRARKKIVPIPVPGPSNASEPSTPTHDFVAIASTSESLSPTNRTNEKRENILMKALDKLDRKIQKLEKTEVDLDDETDSVYLKLGRYRTRFTNIYKKLSEITNAPLHAERKAMKKIHINSTKYPAVNLLVQRWINKKKIFPDFADVHKLIQSQDLGLRPSAVDDIAQEIFQESGEKLQKLRKLDLWESLEGFISDHEDPAKQDAELAAALDANHRAFKKKEKELFEYYVKRQIESKDKRELEEDMDEKSDDEEVEDEEEEGKGGSDVSSNCSEDLNNLEVENGEKSGTEVKIEEKPETPAKTLKSDTEIIVIDYFFVEFDPLPLPLSKMYQIHPKKTINRPKKSTRKKVKDLNNSLRLLNKTTYSLWLALFCANTIQELIIAVILEIFRKGF